ncbi:hypothetical protein EG329_005688 [Mollisiaceae sp. DMI_Dod_QoI]|nr:hypothetical protein EG329_005688 [Helotiales sp. DMI_Dod_QoI]
MPREVWTKYGRDLLLEIIETNYKNWFVGIDRQRYTYDTVARILSPPKLYAAPVLLRQATHEDIFEEIKKSWSTYYNRATPPNDMNTAVGEPKDHPWAPLKDLSGTAKVGHFQDYELAAFRKIWNEWKDEYRRCPEYGLLMMSHSMNQLAEDCAWRNFNINQEVYTPGKIKLRIELYVVSGES